MIPEHLCVQVRKLQGQQAAIAGEARNLIAKSRAKEAANAKLWEQVGTVCGVKALGFVTTNLCTCWLRCRSTCTSEAGCHKPATR